MPPRSIQEYIIEKGYFLCKITNGVHIFRTKTIKIAVLTDFIVRVKMQPSILYVVSRMIYCSLTSFVLQWRSTCRKPYFVYSCTLRKQFCCQNKIRFGPNQALLYGYGKKEKMQLGFVLYKQEIYVLNYESIFS